MLSVNVVGAAPRRTARWRRRAATKQAETRDRIRATCVPARREASIKAGYPCFFSGFE
jgi:hypothetical protein